MSELTGTRKRIYEYIRDHPGHHFRQIRRNLGLAMGDAQYHLYNLEREGLVVSKRRGIYKRFYPSRVFGEKQKDIMGLLSQETPRKILLVLLRKPGASQGQIAAFSKVSPPTITWHMKRLMGEGLVIAHRQGRTTRYWIKGDTGEIEMLMRSYHPKLWESWADRFADVWLEVSSYKKEKEEEEDA